MQMGLNKPQLENLRTNISEKREREREDKKAAASPCYSVVCRLLSCGQVLCLHMLFSQRLWAGSGLWSCLQVIKRSCGLAPRLASSTTGFVLSHCRLCLTWRGKRVDSSGLLPRRILEVKEEFPRFLLLKWSKSVVIDHCCFSWNKCQVLVLWFLYWSHGRIKLTRFSPANELC